MDIRKSKEFLELRDNFDAVMGKSPADLLIKNIKIVDVYSERVKEGSILIKNGIIIALDPPESVQTREVMDGKGLYAAPGFIDAHCHIDSHLVTPAAFADAIVPFGTTTLICEIEDVVGAAKRDGVKAVEVIFSHLDRLPYRVYLQAPGKKVDWDIARAILDMDLTIAQGEFAEMDFLDGLDVVLEQIVYAKSKGKLIHSHVKYFDDAYPANLFAMVGTVNNHNVWDYAQLEECLRLGMHPMVREGAEGALSCSYRTIPGLLNNHLPTDGVLFCTDDLTIPIIYERGHLNYNVKLAIGFGMSPIAALRIASLNAAKSFGLEQQVGSLTPGRFADILFLEDLKVIEPVMVMKGGSLVAENGRLLEQPQIDYSAVIGKAQPGLANLKKQDLEIVPLEVSPDGKQAKVVCLYMGMPSNIEESWLPYENGRIVAPPELSRWSIIQRYADGERKIINGFISKFGLQRGALAGIYTSLTPQICIVGADLDDMYAAAMAMDTYPGGFLAMKDGKVLADLPFEIYGTISTLTAKEIVDRFEKLADAGKTLGYDMAKSISPWVFRMQIMFWMLDRRRLIS
ncbi:MAG: adenine deaminase [Anaerolineaceae bacterium]|nr:adenine deaminase [Anaerolineaceae bacterium]